jgi:hypothetical protein
VPPVNRFTVTPRALRQRGRTSDWMVHAGLETWVMSTNTNREVREVRELSVQELETVSGGWFPFFLASFLASYEQYQAAKTWSEV